MRKFLALLLILCMVLVFTACGSEESSEEPGDQSQETEVTEPEDEQETEDVQEPEDEQEPEDVQEPETKDNLR